MIDAASQAIAVLTIAAVGFGFHTGSPLIAAGNDQAAPPNTQYGHLEDTADPGRLTGRRVAVEELRHLTGSPNLLALLIALSIPYITSAILVVAWMDPGWADLVDPANVPSALVLGTRVLELGLFGTLMAWLVTLLLAAGRGISYWSESWWPTVSSGWGRFRKWIYDGVIAIRTRRVAAQINRLLESYDGAVTLDQNVKSTIEELEKQWKHRKNPP